MKLFFPVEGRGTLGKRFDVFECLIMVISENLASYAVIFLTFGFETTFQQECRTEINFGK